MPLWYNDPCLGGTVLGAWGASPASSKTLGERRDEAADQARTQLARSLRVQVQAMTKDFEGNRDDGTMTDRNQVSRVITDSRLEGATVRALWEHPETGEMLVWVVIDPKLLGKIEKGR